jgi:hypothetical protein
MMHLLLVECAAAGESTRRALSDDLAAGDSRDRETLAVVGLAVRDPRSASVVVVIDNEQVSCLSELTPRREGAICRSVAQWMQRNAATDAASPRGRADAAANGSGKRELRDE